MPVKSPGSSGVAIVRVPPTWLRSAKAVDATHSLSTAVVNASGDAPTENDLPFSCPIRASIRATVPSNSLATQIVFLVAARAAGPLPVGTVVTLFVTGSIRDTDWDSELATHTLPPETRVPAGPA